MAMVLDLDDVRRSYAVRLRAAREGRFTQQSLATELGVSYGIVQTWESTKDPHLPNGENAAKVERLLGVTLLDPHTPDDPDTPGKLSRKGWSPFSPILTGHLVGLPSAA